jgi:hypothetical protein
MIHARYPGAPVEQSSVHVQELAPRHGPIPNARPGDLDGVWADVSGGT